MKPLLLLALLTLTFQAKAAIISTDDSTFGVNSITRDTSTGLDWLDLTKTTSMTYDYISTQFGVGGLYEGFRYATHAELDQLEVNFGFTLINSYNYVVGNGIPAFNFLNLLGNTRPTTVGTANPFTDGLIFGHEVMVVGGVCYDDGICDGSSNDKGHAFSRGIYSSTYSSFDVGSFLVRISDAPATVPEPATIALMGLGFAGMAARRRKSV